jgi:hypothetical protein
MSLTMPPDFAALPEGADADPAFARLHAYWAAKIVAGRLPGRAQIDPLEIPRDLLPDLALLEIEGTDDASRRFRIRLFGSNLIAMTGYDVTGRYYDEVVQPLAYESLRRFGNEMIRQRRAGYLEAASATEGRNHLWFGRLLLPLASDGVHVDMILGLVRPVPARHGPPRG